MWLQKWIWERYKDLRIKIGINMDFTFEEAKEVLSHDSDQTVYKLLNELERLKVIKAERSEKDKRSKKYRITLDMKDVPYSYLSIPSDYKPGQGFLTSTGSMPVQGTQVFLPKSPSEAFEKMYNKKSRRHLTIVPEKAAGTIEEYLARLVQDYKSPDAILTIIKRHKINFGKVARELNSFQKRYLGALLEIADKGKHRAVIGGIYEQTRKDKRIFSIFPGRARKVPKEYKKIAKKWRINLNIDVVDTDEL